MSDDPDALWWRCPRCTWRSWLHYEHCQQCGLDRPVAAPEPAQEGLQIETAKPPPWRYSAWWRASVAYQQLSVEERAAVEQAMRRDQTITEPRLPLPPPLTGGVPWDQ